MDSVHTKKNYRFIILSVAAFIFGLIVYLPNPEGLTDDGKKALAIFVLCIIFWVSHVIPLMITSLLAIILFPLLGVLPAEKTYSLFGNQAVFFILGAFILASAVTRTGLSNRIALMFLKWFGQSPKILLLGVIVLSAFSSFWMSAHAVAAMMFPIITAIALSLELKPGESSYGRSLFLGMAWGCGIGGVATFLGGARGPLAIGMLHDTTGESIGFFKWMLATLPAVITMLAVTYWLLIILFPTEIKDVKKARTLLVNKTACIGKMKRKELSIGILMIATIFSWICFGEKFGLANIALASVVIAFVFRLIRWKEVEEDVNWGLILMYGGAICLGFAMGKTGATRWLVDISNIGAIQSPFVLIMAISLFAIFLTQAMSNTAVVALLMPITIGIAIDFSINPIIMTLAVTVPSGLAFILPMGTPAVAIAHSSGFVTLGNAFKGGFILKIVSWIIFNFFAYYYWPLLGLRL
ncbi:MAG: Sodium-dependent dicarboxylate transporter SdcS [Candidatus Scalindua arabica]|uniref:Sodium-dependent dicarboxylate transporter SdcS n=1 Tax=Candidatus Scalindua arabica TaxID=1127984 RepID=A0A941W4F7_9BACT|nr:Sodium-dependent dicarboxylate transporter SdcS [Candidatus Scalindua arabica]